MFRGDMDKREGWGSHDMASWQGFFDEILKIGQIKAPVKAEDVCTNEMIKSANDFDHAKVKADADAYKHTDAFAAIDVDKVRAHMFDDAV